MCFDNRIYLFRQGKNPEVLAVSCSETSPAWSALRKSTAAKEGRAVCGLWGVAGSEPSFLGGSSDRILGLFFSFIIGYKTPAYHYQREETMKKQFAFIALALVLVTGPDCKKKKDVVVKKAEPTTEP